MFQGKAIGIGLLIAILAGIGGKLVSGLMVGFQKTNNRNNDGSERSENNDTNSSREGKYLIHFLFF